VKYEIKEFDTRYFAGIEHPNGVDISLKQMDLQKTWTELFKVHPEKIENKVEPNNFIGLECYPPDFMDEKVFDYYAMVQTKELVHGIDGIVTKKLPKGKYVQFEIEFGNLKEEIQKVYRYVKDNEMKINNGFDFEQYIDGQDYSNSDAILLFCFLLIE